MREPDGSMNEKNILKKEIVEHRWQEAGRRDNGGGVGLDCRGDQWDQWDRGER